VNATSFKTASMRAAIMVPLALTAACAPSMGSHQYSRSEVGEVRRIERGTIESYRWVEIKGSGGTGALVGAGIGAAAGSTVGSGRGKGAEDVIGAIGGALLGGLLGSSIEKSAKKRSGFEYVIRTESGSMVSIVQADTQPLPEGAPVLIHFSGSRSRVVFDHNAMVPDRNTVDDIPPRYENDRDQGGYDDDDFGG
jgi:outer membrane lipoprotein SlyB